MKFVIISNEFFNIYNFRYKLILKLIDKYPNLNIHIIARYDGFQSLIESISQNITTHNLNINSRSYSLINNVKTFLNIFFLIFKINPSLIISYTIKPNFFCSLLKIFFNFKLITNVTGLGEIYLNKSFFNSYLLKVYKKLLSFSNFVICQNLSDVSLFNSSNSKLNSKLLLIKGSGVDLFKFRYTKLTINKKISFTFIGRIIPEKGIIEFLRAIIKFNRVYPNQASFTIIGKKYPENIKFNRQFDHYLKISRSLYISNLVDPYNFIKSSTCIVLPSYREGLSRVLLESLSVGRILVAANVPGCSELISNHYNGFKFTPKSYNSVFNSLVKVLKFDKNKLITMGYKSRLKSINYSDHVINYELIQLIDRVI